MKVLVAEDDPIAARILARELESAGHEVTLVTNGLEAWRVLQDNTFPIVITDWMMPEMDGIELCRRIRSLWSRGYVYTIMVTAKNDRQDRLDALRAGIDDFLVKPLDPSDLHARLISATRILQMQVQLEERNEDVIQSREQLEEINHELERRERLLSQANEIAEVARNRFSQLFDGLPVAGFTYDTEGTVYEWNQRATEIFFIPGHVALGKKIWNLLDRKLVGERGRTLIEGVFRGQPFEEEDWNDGELFLLVSGYPLYGPDGTITGGISTAVDITPQRKAEARVEEKNAELLAANRKLSALATTDGLTGIANHRALQERLGHFMAGSRRGRPFCLAMVDVDHFKKFNDEFGHQAGDEVLIKVAATLKGSIREVDFVARYGGEEFCALLEDVDIENATMLCNRLRAKIAKISTSYRQITASFGVAQFCNAMSNGHALIQAADDALYRAKQAGRNRVEAAELPNSDTGTTCSSMPAVPPRAEAPVASNPQLPTDRASSTDEDAPGARAA
ncbi:MAG: diguanylate cyclase [Candidatus Eisenbacteria bacterium]|uniref:Diguanylate cyclase n=1 Tax=Eiseniibacteriota bacterium TaxID=2212470 RepID=A0A956LYT4_UNCEI|nr:diguanylate cyclase [Candidatus Eisenbacteria bacterium]